jgi:hypothetical protein
MPVSPLPSFVNLSATLDNLDSHTFYWQKYKNQAVFVYTQHNASFVAYIDYPNHSSSQFDFFAGV